MDWLRALFTDTNAVAHIILVYALVVALGTLLGRIKVAGISLGVTFVLFVGLAAGHLRSSSSSWACRWDPRSSRPSRAGDWF